MLTEFTTSLGPRQIFVQVMDLAITDGDTVDGEPGEVELVFTYRVFDTEEDAEIIQLTLDQRNAIYKAILADLENLCS